MPLSQTPQLRDIVQRQPQLQHWLRLQSSPLDSLASSPRVAQQLSQRQSMAAEAVLFPPSGFK